MVTGIAFGSTNNTDSASAKNAEQRRQEILDKTAATWRECFDYHKKNRLFLNNEEGSEFTFPRVGGALFEHLDFISYIELVDADDPTKQIYRTHSYCKVHNREEEHDDWQVLLEAMVQLQNDDGSYYEEIRTMDDGWHPAMQVFQNAYVDWLGGSNISYSPNLVKVSESSETEYENIVNTIKAANQRVDPTSADAQSSSL